MKTASAKTGRYSEPVTSAALATILPSPILSGWENCIPVTRESIRTHSFFQDKPPKTLLTLSLSEPFEGFHYKLVAGVVNLPV